MKDLDRYIQRVTAHLDSKSEKKFYTTHIREALGEEADKLSFDEITQRIGEPESGHSLELTMRTVSRTYARSPL